MSVGSNFRKLMFANVQTAVFVHERDRCNKTTDADVRVVDKSDTTTRLQLPTLRMAAVYIRPPPI